MTSSNTDSDSDEVEFLHETYKGKEVITLQDEFEHANDTEQTSRNYSSPSMIGFRLLDLPAELRIHVYSFLIPHNMEITFERYGWSSSNEPDWTTNAFRKDEDVSYKIGSNPYYKNTKVRRYNHFTVETQLFRVSKFVSNETKSVMYGSNTYNFTVHGNSMWPKSLRSPFVFGPLGHPDRLPLLRNLRSIHIDVIPDVDSHWAVKRQRSRLEYLVEILKEHADDTDQKSLLQDLKVDFQLVSQDKMKRMLRDRPTWQQVVKPSIPEDTGKFMFGLESLASLRGIRDVEINGLPEWYTKCLQLAIRGKGGDIQETDWPLVEVKRRANGKRRSSKKLFVSIRKWHQPTLDWKEFAERNDITTPADIGKFWADET
ncbi:hypothetical protein J4E80_000302 [Alternaria sp. BMP 0032]|nr:hypothetical protein J4E80_000302 [Alternaria sp. BMP 0032]